MPFRVRYRQQCLTSVQTTPIVVTNMSSCVNFNRGERFMELYNQQQLFYFYPLIKTPQKLFQYVNYPHHVVQCLTAFKSQGENIAHLSMDSCTVTSGYKAPSSQMFTIERINITRIDKDENNAGSTANLKPVSAALIKWVEPPGTNTYCMYYLPSADEGNTPLIMKNCKEMMKNPSRNSNIFFQGFSFVLERTKTEGVPYRPGLTVGKWPTWGEP